MTKQQHKTAAMARLRLRHELETTAIRETAAAIAALAALEAAFAEARGRRRHCLAATAAILGDELLVAELTGTEQPEVRGARRNTTDTEVNVLIAQWRSRLDQPTATRPLAPPTIASLTQTVVSEPD